ncbi:MAG: ATP-dependent RecD-like DNA helicase, partial [Acidobacteria bacterium]|nr:ATP-dependent RecD-like DNA helicase [Acidobacteriota bacterium]
MPDHPRAGRLPLSSPRRRPLPQPAPGGDPTSLAGTVERVTFHSADSGFCVLRVKVTGRRDLETVVGHAASISAGEEIRAVGEWANDLVHGVQFRATSIHSAPPTSVDGIERYLGSGLIRGIGPVFARKLVESFGAQVFEVIDSQPARLRDVDGIGPGRAAQIVDAWSGQKVIREIMVFLYANGVGTSRAV